MTTLLSRTESRVVKLLAYPTKISAHRLGMHESTVKMHQRNIERKLGAANRFSACVIAARMGIAVEIMERATA